MTLDKLAEKRQDSVDITLGGPNDDNPKTAADGCGDRKIERFVGSFSTVSFLCIFSTSPFLGGEQDPKLTWSRNELDYPFPDPHSHLSPTGAIERSTLGSWRCSRQIRAQASCGIPFALSGQWWWLESFYSLVTRIVHHLIVEDCWRGANINKMHPHVEQAAQHVHIYSQPITVVVRHFVFSTGAPFAPVGDTYFRRHWLYW